MAGSFLRLRPRPPGPGPEARGSAPNPRSRVGLQAVCGPDEGGFSAPSNVGQLPSLSNRIVPNLPVPACRSGRQSLDLSLGQRVVEDAADEIGAAELLGGVDD